MRSMRSVGVRLLASLVTWVTFSPAILGAQAPATSGFYIHSETGWLPLTAYAEFHAATETLRLVNGWTDDIPNVTNITRFAVQMPTWRVSGVLVTGDDLFASRYAERRHLTFGVRRTSVYGWEVNVGKGDPANLDKLLAQVGVPPDRTGYVFLVVASDGFPTRYYPVRVRRRAAGASTAVAPERPTIVEWPGSCPVECCGYGAMWTAIQETAAVAAPLVPTATTGTSAFTVPAGAVVRAVTGTLYTLESGTARVDQDFSTDATSTDFSARHKQPVTFIAGKTITLLAALGNGVYRIQHDGRVLDANLYRIGTIESCADVSARCAGVVTKPPVTEWWVMVLDAEKRTGWINQPARFVRGACK